MTNIFAPATFKENKIYKTINLPVLLYGYETWSHIMGRAQIEDWEQDWTKKGEVTGGWRKLHNEEFYNLFSSPNIIRMIRWAGLAAHMEEMRSTYNN
jgi:hypothetical protein